MPNPLPLSTIVVQRVPILFSSPALRVDGINEVSVKDGVMVVVTVGGRPGHTGGLVVTVVIVWVVVIHASMPGTNVAVVAFAAELLQLPPTGTVAKSLTTTDLGTLGVRVLLIKSFFTDNDTRPFGVTGQLQQAISSSVGSNTYTFAHKAPVSLAPVPLSSEAPEAPELVMSITESLTSRLAA